MKSKCANCGRADTNRKNDGRIRCTRFSRWVYPFEDSCEGYYDKALAEMKKELFKELPKEET